MNPRRIPLCICLTCAWALVYLAISIGLKSLPAQYDPLPIKIIALLMCSSGSSAVWNWGRGK